MSRTIKHTLTGGFGLAAIVFLYGLFTSISAGYPNIGFLENILDPFVSVFYFAVIVTGFQPDQYGPIIWGIFILVVTLTGPFLVGALFGFIYAKLSKPKDSLSL